MVEITVSLARSLSVSVSKGVHVSHARPTNRIWKTLRPGLDSKAESLVHSFIQCVHCQHRHVHELLGCIDAGRLRSYKA